MDQPIPLTVPFGEMESWPRMKDDEYLKLRERNRERFAVDRTTQPRLVVMQTADHEFDDDETI